MDCLCAHGGIGPSSDEEFLGSVCNLMGPDGSPAKFPAEPDRYILYVIAGCPFAARPWAIASFYGLPIQVIKLFPSSSDQGWFFHATTPGEKEQMAHFPEAVIDTDPCYGSSHLKELYTKANPNFKGAVSVPLLWDKVNNTAVSNSSLGLAEMMCTQMRSMATRNNDVELFPSDPEEYQKHSDLVKEIHSRISVYVYKLNASGLAGKERDELITAYYDTLAEFQQRLSTSTLSSSSTSTSSSSSSFLMGTSNPRFVDLLLWISLIRYDLAYCWRFGMGKYTIREDFPGLQSFVQQMMKVEGLKETIFPRDIMALYFMTLKFAGTKFALPHVPHQWEKEIMGTFGSNN